MAEPFKNLLNKKVIENMGLHLQKSWLDFDHHGFTNLAQKDLNKLELKERSLQITHALATFLPNDFKKACKIILKSIGPPLNGDNLNIGELSHEGITGWAMTPLTQYIGLHGQDHFDLSMDALKEMTKRLSSEFDIRYFLIKDPQRTLLVLQTWTTDPNQHVRRLVSEGTRTRLPWGTRLNHFINDPKPVISLLEILKDDKEEYVRRSVANNLNDIAKDHPDLVAGIAKKWLGGADANRARLVRHACRTLIKQGHQKTLRALGYGPPLVEIEAINIQNKKVKFGDALEFQIILRSISKKEQPLIIDYAIHHMKANGKQTKKVFKWKTTTLATLAKLEAKKKHNMKKITTRVYYQGKHTLEILINGVSFYKEDFELIM